MLARLHSVTLEGIEGIICEVEVDVARGGFEKSIIVGLPDTAVKESIEDTFKNTKQSLGSEEPQTWKGQGPERAAVIGHAVLIL